MKRPVRGLVLLAALAAFAAPVLAAPTEVYIHVPVVTAAPGASVNIPLDMDRSLVPLNVLSVDYAMNIDPAYVSSVTLLADGVAWWWGAPFTNVTPTKVYLAAAGATPIGSSSTRLHSLQFQVSPTAPVGGTMPITFSAIRFNEGTPKAQPSLGLLEIRTGTVDAPEAGGAEALALAPASPNPVRTGATFRCRVPSAGRAGAARLALYGVDGRRVRSYTLSAGAGERSVAWDARDESGRAVPAGVYVARLEWGAESVTRRCIVVR